MNLSSFKEIVKNYKVVFFDSYGVLRNYKGIFAGVKEMFEFLDSQGIVSFLLTNDASRSPKDLAAQFQAQGILSLTDDKIISSATNKKGRNFSQRE